MRFVSLLLLLVSILSCYSQDKKMKVVSGMVSDLVTFDGIQGVLVYSKDSSYFDTTDAKGFYEIIIPRNTGRLSFYHPDYKFRSMRFHPSTSIFDVRLSPLLDIQGGKTIIDKYGENIEMKYLNGFVDNRKSKHHLKRPSERKYEYIPNVQIYTKNRSISTQTDSNGYYRIWLPKKERTLIFEHPDFKIRTISLASISRRVDISLAPLDTSGPANDKHAIGWLPTKLVWGMISFKYEFWVVNKKSIGLYADYYLYGYQVFGGEKFTGFKLTPFFRHYFKRTAKRATYVQGSAIVAYFDFEKLNYSNHPYYPYETSVRYIFWTGGFGVALGWYYKFTDTKKSNLYVDINLGTQILPATWPNKIIGPHGITYEHNKTWWYLGGPGSFIELKIALGGIF